MKKKEEEKRRKIRKEKRKKKSMPRKVEKERNGAVEVDRRTKCLKIPNQMKVNVP